jgi:DNA adenine methylase
VKAFTSRALLRLPFHGGLPMSAGVPWALRKLRPLLKTHGGKAYLARRIIAVLLEHSVYAEAFAGGCSVLLNKLPLLIEYATDIDPRLINLYLQLRGPKGPELIRRLAATPYSRGTFESARDCDQSTGLDGAWAFLVTNRQSRGGLGLDFAWSDRLRGGQPGDVNGWETIVRDLPRIRERLAHVDIRCEDAVETIERVSQRHGSDALVYCDPPYLHQTRSALETYAYEMSDANHARLLDVLCASPCAVALSGYANPLYNARLAGWNRVEFDMPNHAGQGKTKQRRVEVLWLKHGRVD